MTIRYCASTGSNTAPYDTWAKAATALKTVTDLMGAGDITYMRNETQAITVGTTYTIAGSAVNPGIIISTASTAEPPTTYDAGALIDASATTTVSITLLGKAKIFGAGFKSGGSTGLGSIIIATNDEDMIDMEDSPLTIANTSAASEIQIGTSGSTTIQAYFRSKGCTFTLGNNAAQKIDTYTRWDDSGSTFGITTTQPTAYFTGTIGEVTLHGSDLSAITGTLISGSANRATTFRLSQCKLGSGVAILGTSGGPGHTEAFLYDCASGDAHYEFGHYNYYGNTVISTAIYMSGSDGASYNVANSKHSWKITGVNGTYATPYVSPPISVYNEGTSAVTPRLEVLRDGSTTAYNDDQAWAEISYKGTSGSTRATIVSDRRGPCATAAAQASSALGAGDWVGETTPWYGKLEPTATITPAEIGDICARVCVAGSITLYANPKILGI